MSKTADFNSRDAFFTSFIALVEGLTKKQAPDSNLDILLKSWKLKRVIVPGDGNCLFTSVANSLVQRSQSGDTAVLQILVHLGVPETQFMDIDYIQKLLRVRMVQEWNSNLEYYQGFLTVDLSAVSRDFLESSQFSGNAGDLMVLTIANVLQIPITIFTSAQNMPLVCVMPTAPTLLSTQPLCLAYTQDTNDHPGHYDYVVSMDEASLPEPKRVKVQRCTCGWKPDSTTLPCSVFRCPCFREKKACSKACMCKN